MRTARPINSSRAKFLFSVLFALCQGRALGYVRAAEGGSSGFRVWNRLIREYEPDVASRRMSMLAGLLNVQFSADRFEEQLLEWERKIAL